MKDEEKIYYTFEERTQIEDAKDEIKSLEEIAHKKIEVLLKKDAKDEEDAIKIYNSLKEISRDLEENIRIINDSLKVLGRNLFEDGKRIAIPNYLYSWFKFDKNINPEDCEYFIVKDSEMLLKKVEYDSKSKYCLLEDMTYNSSVTISMGKFKPTKPEGHQFSLPITEVIPLTKIKEPILITLRDLFHTSGECWPSVRRIESFSTNPWSGHVDSFVSNSIYSPKKAYGQMNSIWKMIQGSDELEALLNSKK